MNRNGFTLIELLAVIIIIAVIASITVISVNKTLNNSKNTLSDVQIDNIIKASQSYYLEEGLDRNVSCINVADLISKNYIDSKQVIDPKTRNPMEGSVTISSNGSKVLYDYSEDKCKLIYRPQYYWYDLTTGNIDDSLPSNASVTPPEGKQIYLGFNVDNNKISEAYVCFVRNGVEYCVEGNNPGAYNTNIEIMKDAFSDVLDTDCNFFGSLTECSTYIDTTGINISIDQDGIAIADYMEDTGDLRCQVYSNDEGFECTFYTFQ